VSRRVRVVIGLVLVWGALGVVGYRLGWTVHQRHGADALLRKAASVPCRDTGLDTQARDGELTGVLTLPTLDVRAPVVQGTSDAVLDVAVGHAPSTPLPGTPGTAVLLAHDVSYFADIDQLAPGDEVRYRAGCTTAVFRVTGHRVVAAGSAVPSQPGDGPVLDTCWPTNALWYTPDRYLVEAVQSSVVHGSGANASTTSVSRSVASWPTDYTTPAPPALVAQGLTLVANEEPMGTLQLGGTPARAWTQSPVPLDVEAAGLAAYFGGLKAAAEHHLAWWQALAPGVPEPPALSGATVTGHDAPLDVTVDATGTTPSAVVLDTTLTLSGGTAPGTYHEQVTEAVHGLDVVVTHWVFTQGEADHG